MMELTSQNVHELLPKLFADDGQEHPDTIKVEGLTMNLGFDPAKVEEHRQDIIDMLMQLPKEFMAITVEGGGGGWSFVNACYRADGEQWTGFHRIMEELFIMGIAAGVVGYLMPRPLWPILGGVPYLIIDPNGVRPEDLMPGELGDKFAAMMASRSVTENHREVKDEQE